MQLPDFTGEIGGVLATMFIAGFSTGWTLCVKIMVTPARERLKELRDDMARDRAEITAIRARIEEQFWKMRQ